MDGKAIAQEVISRFDLRDSAGRPHEPSGLLSSLADVLMFVAYDSHPDIGRRMHFFPMAKVRDYVLACVRSGTRPTAGSRDGVNVSDTGFGYKALPAALNGVALPLTSANLDAEEVAREWLRSGRAGWRNATAPEQKIDGIDLVVTDSGHLDLLLGYWNRERGGVWLEVKSRSKWKDFDRIFLQISETNSARQYSSVPIAGAAPRGGYGFVRSLITDSGGWMKRDDK